MAINTQIPSGEWSDFFTTFSNDTRGRPISIQVLDVESGDTGVVAKGNLLAVDYDPVKKGNDIIITIGSDKIDASHTINAPVELWRAQRDSGEINALEIIDQNNDKTILIIE